MRQIYNFSVISEHEAIMMYNNAKDKRIQVGVLADLLCCTKEDVRKLLREHGCEPDQHGTVRKRTPGKNDWKDEETAVIVQMFDEGASVEQMAAMVGRSRNSVRTKLKKMGRFFRKRGFNNG